MMDSIAISFIFGDPVTLFDFFWGGESNISPIPMKRRSSNPHSIDLVQRR